MTFSVMWDVAAQISDLQFLLELFSRWHLRVFPHTAQFDDFIMNLEKMSAKSIVKVGDEGDAEGRVARMPGQDREIESGRHVIDGALVGLLGGRLTGQYCWKEG